MSDTSELEMRVALLESQMLEFSTYMTNHTDYQRTIGMDWEPPSPDPLQRFFIADRGERACVDEQQREAQ